MAIENGEWIMRGLDWATTSARRSRDRLQHPAVGAAPPGPPARPEHAPFKGPVPGGFSGGKGRTLRNWSLFTRNLHTAVRKSVV